MDKQRQGRQLWGGNTLSNTPYYIQILERKVDRIESMLHRVLEALEHAEKRDE